MPDKLADLLEKITVSLGQKKLDKSQLGFNKVPDSVARKNHW